MNTKKTLKGLGLTITWTAIAAILLIVGLITTVVKILNPERLTPLVESCASRLLDADVCASRVELTFWSSFPNLKLEVDSLEVVSRSLTPLSIEEKASLPTGADTLMTVGNFTGAIDLAKLPLAKLSFNDVIIDRPMVNIVSVNDSIANFNIFESESADTTAFVMPDIAINRFAITNAKPFKYTSIADSLQGSVLLKEVEFSGELPTYTFELDGCFDTPLLKEYNLDGIKIAFNGGVEWERETPMTLNATNLTIGIGALTARLNSQLTFDKTLKINNLDITAGPVKIADITRHVPSDYRNAIAPLKSDMSLQIDLSLTQPYEIGDIMRFPSADLKVNIPDCYLRYGQIDLRTLGLDLAATIDGNDINASKVTVNRFIAAGPATDISFSGNASSFFTDPSFNGELTANMILNRLPKQLRDLIPGKISGTLHADLSIKGRRSHLSRSRFHKLKVEGDLSGDGINLAMNDSSLTAWFNKIEIDFGTSKSFVNDVARIDSLLAASLKVDTATVETGGMDIILSRFAAGIGSSNRSNSLDTTQINPLGGSISLHRLYIESPADSSRLRLRDISCRGSLKRFEGQTKVPQLELQIKARRISSSDPVSRFSLREGDINITAHYKPRKNNAGTPNVKTQALKDSIMAANPEIPADSALVLARAERRRLRQQEIEEANNEGDIEFGLDANTKKLLRRWDIRGTFKAKRGRLITPFFPLRNTLSDINVQISNDSLIVHDMTYKVGRSDFLVYGTVSNIRQALTSRKHVPLKIDMGVESDTINVNEIVDALFAGSALIGDSTILSSTDDEDALQASMEAESDSVVGALLIPCNIDATFRFRALNIIYADLLLKRFRGKMMIYDGAISLDRLSARSDIGGILMSALYSAPNKENMQFGFGMQVKQFQIHRFNQLFPAIDSIMPMMGDLAGVVDADIAATTDVDTMMNLKIPTLKAAIKIEGDSLVLIDQNTFKTIGKWLMFKDKSRNVIDHMSVEAIVSNSMLELYPFMFNIDRYKLGVMGHNDLDLNYDYHISVLKSPIPFKFGINLRGTPDDMKIRFGGAKFKENMVGQQRAIVDTTRINLIENMEAVFRKGVSAARLGSLDIEGRPRRQDIDDIPENQLNYADSLRLYQEGILDVAPTPPVPAENARGQNNPKK